MQDILQVIDIDFKNKRNKLFLDAMAHFKLIRRLIMRDSDAYYNGKVFYRSQMKWEEEKKEVLC